MVLRASKKEKMTDEEFAKHLEPHENAVINYITQDFIYDFFAFVLADAFDKDCIWDDSTLEFEYIDAIDYLQRINFPGYKKIDIVRLNNILEKKYSLKVISEDPIKIEKIQ